MVLGGYRAGEWQGGIAKSTLSCFFWRNSLLNHLASTNQWFVHYSFTFAKILRELMRQSWWKVVCVLLVGYTIVGGLLLPVPALEIINETIRNLYFHVPMWFTMIILFLASFVY